MKSVQISPLPRAVKAEVDIPGSKSYTNRALLLAALTPQTVRIVNPLICDDTKTMTRCLEALGIKVRSGDSYLEVSGDVDDIPNKDYELNAGLSGITMRFMLALSCVIPGQQTVRGEARLNQRPVGELVDSLRQLGANIEYLGKTGYPPLRVTSGVLYSGTAKLVGGTSSQYLSALLMIAPLAGGLGIEVTGELGSKPYVDMTIAAMKHFGVKVTSSRYRSFRIASGQNYQAAAYRVEGDVSSASYFLAIAALTGSTLTLKNLNPDSLQADMGFLKILESMGNQLTYGENEITIAGKGVKPANVNMQDCPDQAQTLAVLAAFAKGVTTITGIRSLRIKETERIKAVQQELKKMGIETSSTHDTLVIHGGQPKAASIATHGDHRMAMSFAVAGTKLPGMRIEDPGVVAKTFPDFWSKLEGIGITTKEVD